MKMDQVPELPSVFDDCLDDIVAIASELPYEERQAVIRLLKGTIEAVRSATTDIDKLIFYSNPVIEKLYGTVARIPGKWV